jgi:hypothetical protein
MLEKEPLDLREVMVFVWGTRHVGERFGECGSLAANIFAGPFFSQRRQTRAFMFGVGLGAGAGQRTCADPGPNKKRDALRWNMRVERSCAARSLTR